MISTYSVEIRKWNQFIFEEMKTKARTRVHVGSFHEFNSIKK